MCIPKNENEILDIFRTAGFRIEPGDTFSAKGQIAQLLNGANLLNVELEHKARLLASCEKSLSERDERITKLTNMLTDRLDLIKCGIAHNYGGDPYENDLYTSVVELLSVT